MKPKIKIAYIIDSINSVAGTEKQLLQTIQHLNKERFEVKLICLRKPSSIFHEDRKIFEYIELDNTRLLTLRSLIKFIWLIFYLRKEKIDIIQTFFFDSTVFGIFAGKIARVKILLSCRRDLGFWYTPKLIRVLRLINKLTTRILANSNAVKNHASEYEKIPINKIDVIKNGIDLSPFKQIQNREEILNTLGINDNHHFVGIIANLNRPVKRVDIFLKAASLVLKEMTTVSFIIVGDGYLRNELNKLVNSLGINKSIYFLGRRTNVHSIISFWDIGVITSDSEGFSNAILEYMAAGVPTIATCVGGNAEAVIKSVNGLLVEVDDPQSLADNICILLKNDTKRREMSDMAKLIVQKEYAWEEKTKEIDFYYNNLMLE